MQRNKIIHLGILLNRLILWLCYLVFATLTVIVVHWHFDAAFYDQVNIGDSFKPGYGATEFILELGRSAVSGDVYLSNLSQIMLYWLYLRSAIFFIITIIILRQIGHILNSIKSMQTFYESNIVHFRKIAKWCFIAFPISVVNFNDFSGAWHFDFGLVWGPLLVGVASLIIAEIFKEGKELSEDQKMIV